MKEKILIIGASGLIGQELTHQLFKRDYNVIIGINTRTIFPRVPKVEFKIDLLSYENVKEVITSESPDIIINLAAISSRERCEKEKDIAYKLNVRGVKYLTDSASCLENKPLFMQLSTDHVFNGFDGRNGNYSEEDIKDPVGYYGKTKSESEKIVNQSGLESIIIRTSLTFGDYKYTHGSRFDRLNHMITSRLKQGETFEVDINSIISPTYLEYLCEGIIFLLENKNRGIFHIAGRDALSKYEFAKEIAKLFGMEYADRITLKEKQGIIKNTSLNIQKITDSGFYQLGIKEALSRYKSKSKIFSDK